MSLVYTGCMLQKCMLGKGSIFTWPILSVPGWMVLVFKVVTGAFSVTYPVSN